MKNSKKTEAQKKATKAAYDKAYRERKRAQMLVGRPVEEEVIEEVTEEVIESVANEIEVIETPPAKNEVITEFPPSNFDGKFDYPIRTYWNLKLEKSNSSCAKAGTELTFEFISQDEDGVILYRIRRGKRHFYTSSEDLKSPKK